MALLLLDDLNEANNASSKELVNLLKDTEDAEQLINLINDFISDSVSELKGNAYDRVREHLSGYVDVLETRVKIANEIIQSIHDANDYLIDYMDGENKLDTSMLESLENDYNNCLNQIQAYDYRINNYDSSKETVSLSSIKLSRSGYEVNANKAKKKIDLIKGLSSADSTASSKLNSAESDLSAFKTTINNISNIKIEKS